MRYVHVTVSVYVRLREGRERTYAENYCAEALAAKNDVLGIGSVTSRPVDAEEYANLKQEHPEALE